MQSTYKEIYQFIKHIRGYIWVSTAIFILFVLVGYNSPEEFKKGLLEAVGTLAKTLAPGGLHNTTFFNLLIAATLIFLNNYIKATFSMFTGYLLSIPSLIILISNAVILGVIYDASDHAAQFLLGILPHGLTELFSFILSAAISLWVTVTIFKQRTDIDNKYRGFRFLSKVNLYLVLPLMLFSAIIEIFVTVKLLSIYA